MDCLKTIGFIVLVALSSCNIAKAAEGGEAVPVIQDIEDIRISILQKQKVAGFYSAYMKVEATGQDAANILHRLMPRVRNAIIVNLSSYLPIVWSRDDPPSHETMVSLIEQAIQSVCPPETLQKVYLSRATFSLPQRR